MHPMAVLGILAVVGALVAAGVALGRLSAFGVALGPVLLGNGIPLLLFVGGAALTMRLVRQGRPAAPLLVVAFLVAAVAYWVINFG